MAKANNFHAAAEHHGIKEEVWQTKVREAVYHKLLLHNHHTKHAKFQPNTIDCNHMRGLSHRLSSHSCDCGSKLWPALFSTWLFTTLFWVWLLTAVFQHGLCGYFALWLIRMHMVTPPLPYYVGSRCMVAVVTAVHVGVTVPSKSE